MTPAELDLVRAKNIAWHAAITQNPSINKHHTRDTWWDIYQKFQQSRRIPVRAGGGEMRWVIWTVCMCFATLLIVAEVGVLVGFGSEFRFQAPLIGAYAVIFALIGNAAVIWK